MAQQEEKRAAFKDIENDVSSLSFGFWKVKYYILNE